MRSSFVAGTAVVVSAVAVAISAKTVAAQITPGSTLTFTGVADATDIGLPGVILDFTPKVSVATSGNTGTFAEFNTSKGKGASGKISDIRVGNGPEPIRKFFKIGAYTFNLNSLPSGPYGQDACYIDPVPGQTCTPYQSVQGDPSVNAGLSPFYVENVASGNPDAPINSTAAFHLIGTVSGPKGAMSDFFGTITASFIGQSYQEVLYTLEQQGLQGLTFTGTFVAGTPISGGDVDADLTTGVVPEPSTYVLLAAGLVGIAGVARRRRLA